MGLLSTLRDAALRSLGWSGPLMSSSPELARLWGSPATSTGIGVNEQTALTYSVFFACVYGISTDVGSVPLIHYKRLKEGGKERYTDSKLYWMLHDEPNPESGSMTMREAMTAHVLTWGNCYAEIVRDGAGRPSALWPLTPDRVTPFRQRDGRGRRGPIRYRIDGQEELPASEVLHVPGLGFDGTIGYSVVEKARESIGLGLAAERFGGSFYGNGATFGGVISYPGPRPPELSEKNYRETLDTQHKGVDRAHKLLALYGGAKYERMGIPPNDAQFLETRQHQVEEICRWFRMPPHKVQHLLRSTNNNIEHQGIEYYKDTMRPWCVRWEQEINRKLIPPLERRQQFVEHMVDAVFRGDLPSRYQAYAVGRQWGWLSADDVREKENMNPLPNGAGKIYLVPMNMTPADRITELIDAQIKAKETPPPPALPPAEPKPEPNMAEEEMKAIRAALSEAEVRAEAHLAKAVALETEKVTAETSADEMKAAIEQERAAALEAAREVAVLKALHLEAVERADRERADREALAASVGKQIETVTTRAVTAEAASTEALAERDRLQAQMADLERTYTCAQTTIAVMELACQRNLVSGEQLAELETQLSALQAVRETMATELETVRQALAAAETQIVETATARAELAAALDARQDAERQRLIGVIGAHRALIVDAMGRMVRRETEKARRNQATPAKLRAWAESFYLTHEETCLDALRPAMRTHLTAVGHSTEDVDTFTRLHLHPQLEAALAQIRTVADGDPEDFPVTLEKVLTRWEQDRPDALADLVLREEIEYVRNL